MKKRKDSATLLNMSPGRSDRPKSGRSEEKIDQVEIYLLFADARASPRKIATLSEVHRSSVKAVLKKDLHLESYRPTVAQELSQSNFQKRLKFCQRLKMNVDEGSLKLNKLIPRDEAHFCVKIKPNKQTKLANLSNFAFSTPLCFAPLLDISTLPLPYCERRGVSSSRERFSTVI